MKQITKKTFDLIDYVDNLTDLSDNFWEDKLKTDIIQFITREKHVPQDDLKVIINHPYEGNVMIIKDQYIFYYIHTLCKEFNFKPEQFTVIPVIGKYLNNIITGRGIISPKKAG